MEGFVEQIEYFQEHKAFRGLREKRYGDYRSFECLKKEREAMGKNLIAALFKSSKKE